MSRGAEQGLRPSTQQRALIGGGIGGVAPAIALQRVGIVAEAHRRRSALLRLATPVGVWLRDARSGTPPVRKSTGKLFSRLLCHDPPELAGGWDKWSEPQEYTGRPIELRRCKSNR